MAGDEDSYIDEAEASKVLRTSVNTLRFWRYNRKGPRFYKIGRRVAYRRADLAAFMAACVVEPGQGRARA